MKYILMSSVLLNVAFAVYLVIFSASGHISAYMIASTSQLECLENWKGAMKVVSEVDYPEHFEGHYIISIPKMSNKKLYAEYSGCFYDAHSMATSVDGILSIYSHFQSEWGYEDVSIYKSPDKENAIIYAK
ncbi:hypothetical protein ACR0ST_09770 [Aliidiomarina sp. Khilg15.8]